MNMNNLEKLIQITTIEQMYSMLQQMRKSSVELEPNLEKEPNNTRIDNLKSELSTMIRTKIASQLKYTVSYTDAEIERMTQRIDQSTKEIYNFNDVLTAKLTTQWNYMTSSVEKLTRRIEILEQELSNKVVQQELLAKNYDEFIVTNQPDDEIDLTIKKYKEAEVVPLTDDHVQIDVIETKQPTDEIDLTIKYKEVLKVEENEVLKVEENEVAEEVDVVVEEVEEVVKEVVKEVVEDVVDEVVEEVVDEVLALTDDVIKDENVVKVNQIELIIEESEPELETDKEDVEENVEDDVVEDDVVEDDVVEDDVVEDDVVEDDVVEDDVEVQEEVEVQEDVVVEEDEEEVFEIEIDDVTYYATSEENGILYEMLADGEIGKQVGVINDGEPIFKS